MMSESYKCLVDFVKEISLWMEWFEVLVTFFFVVMIFPLKIFFLKPDLCFGDVLLKIFCSELSMIAGKEMHIPSFIGLLHDCKLEPTDIPFNRLYLVKVVIEGEDRFGWNDRNGFVLLNIRGVGDLFFQVHKHGARFCSMIFSGCVVAFWVKIVTINHLISRVDGSR